MDKKLEEHLARSRELSATWAQRNDDLLREMETNAFAHFRPCTVDEDADVGGPKPKSAAPEKRDG